MNKKTNKIQLQVVGLSHNPNMGNSFALVLGEITGNRRLPIIIGEKEAQSIVMVLEGIIPQRPMTHDLLVKLCVEHNIEVFEIIIYSVENGTFYSKLICEDYKGDIKEIDSRTSDAISLALRFECPIYAYEWVVDKSSIEVNSSNYGAESKSINKKETQYDMKLLEKDLDEAVKTENFERAASIRDIISEKMKN